MGGGKPKVVVPSPKGIPKPIPRAKNRESAALKANRDSVASNDSFNDAPLPLTPASAQQLAKVAAETEMLALFSTRRNTVDGAPEGGLQGEETEEFKRAVDRFDQLYQEEEKEEQKVEVTTKEESEEVTTVVTKRQKKNKIKESRTQSVNAQEQDVSQTEWKQIKKGGSFEETSENDKKEGKNVGKNKSKKKRGRIEGHVEISLEYVHNVAKNMSSEEDAAVSSRAPAKRDFSKEDGEFTEFQRKLIQKTQEAQDSIQSTLLDMETDRMESEVVRVQRHSLCVDHGVMVERTTTTLARNDSEDLKEEKSAATLSHTESEESKEEESQIDPDSLKNVDGQAKARKGSSRFSKRQNSKSKSPRNSLTTSESVGEDAEAQTNERMKKLSATFSSAASHDGEVMMGRDEWPEEEEVVVSARNSASDQTLVRTTRIRVVDPLDGMIESMIQKPEEVVNNSPTTSSESYSTPGASSSPHVYRAVVVQHHEQVETIRSQEVSAMRQRLGLDG